MIVLFAGPSLAGAELPARGDVRVLPPVAQGDVFRAARHRPWGIGIIDGQFEHVPAVWHKEILWALSRGVHVYGAASMGALRAAELAAFGMVGIGRIFEQLASGALTRDDEVAVAHLPAEHGYRAVSDALVDIRATLEAAVASGGCGPALAARLLDLARDRFYPERTWPAILAAAHAGGGAGGEDDEIAAFERWLRGGRVEQKRRDALALIDAMQAARVAHPAPFQPGFAFETTDLWERAVHRMVDEGAEPGAPTVSPACTSADSSRLSGSHSGTSDALLDELRLTGDEPLYRHAIDGALGRALAEDTAARHGLHVGPDLVQRTALEYRRALGLVTGTAMAAWLAEQALDAPAFFDLMTREARLRWARAVSEPDLRRHLADQLCAMGCHGRLLARARAKQRALERAGLTIVDLPTVPGEPWPWYFARLGVPVPDDLAGHARRLGFADLGELRRAVELERWYATAASRAGEAAPRTTSHE